MKFEDNKLVPLLFGEQNTHLQTLEKTFGVQIDSRGNEILIRGDQSGTANARQILESLWSKLQKGEDVDPAMVDSAIRFLHPNGETTDETLRSFTQTETFITTRKKKIQPRSPLQAAYIQAMHNKQLVFGIGPAGTGKTYLAIAAAVEMMERGDVERIILSRPAVEAGEHLGFLPGELQQKMDPYMRPLYDALQDTMGAERLQKLLATQEIEIAPLAYMRGRTLNNAFVILDEAQNTTTMQMMMVLTRIGNGSHMVITGDPSQTDLPPGKVSGLVEAADVLAGEDAIAFINFTHKDVVRSALVTKIIQAYDKRKIRTE
ncbi:MAG: PhoH family protein [Alphaproteobacteria bacterium]|nr:PhoH family protein [Alphaproteobacteria bacterium]MBU0858419.1 PhoH family protein [Alphaproteobacteria bacterium]